jgi:RNA polymerase sigma factor (TIGR02999 family)
MSEIRRILEAIHAGDPQAASRLLPLVYDELRRLAAVKMALENAGHTLDPTALVHEAWIRLAGTTEYASKSHFLRAAGEAIRRILVDHARAKRADKRGGHRHRVAADNLEAPQQDPDLLDLDEALNRLAVEDPLAAQVVEMHHFAGLAHEQTAETLGITVYLARQKWNYARAWLKAELGKS